MRNLKVPISNLWSFLCRLSRIGESVLAMHNWLTLRLIIIRTEYTCNISWVIPYKKEQISSAQIFFNKWFAKRRWDRFMGVKCVTHRAFQAIFLFNKNCWHSNRLFEPSNNSPLDIMHGGVYLLHALRFYHQQVWFGCLTNAIIYKI